MKTLVAITTLVKKPMALFAKDSGEQVFWKWFQKHEPKLYQFEKNQESVLDEISVQLAKYKKGLVFEISKEHDGKREFIVSADGLKELFPAVEALKSCAPKLGRWSIVAFRPRMEAYERLSLTYGGKEFDPGKLWTYHRIQDGSLDLIVYHPDYLEEERNAFVSGTYILLDMALGEYDVVTGIRHIDHKKIPDEPRSEGLRPFAELRATFDEYKARNR
jgi:hypothetical protein